MSHIRHAHQCFLAGDAHLTVFTQRYLDRIAQFDTALQAYLYVNQDAAHHATGSVPHLLSGIPIAIKDLLHVPSMPTTCASKILEGYRPPFVSTAVQRLLDAGVIVLGKTNLDEFAMGASTEHSAFGITRNPWHLEYTPGGSSGGSAAAVAADLCVAALGTDTGGSIRQPASLCGIVGFKPTYGRVSRYGLVAFASSLDQIGPMARTVEDCAIMYDAIAGYDPADATSLNVPVTSAVDALQNDVQGLRIGVPEEYFAEGINPDIEAAVRTAIGTLAQLGATVTPVHLPHTKYAVPCYYITAPAEASANLARYDGIRFGHRDMDARNLTDLYQQSRSRNFGPEVTRRIMLGTYVLSSGYYDAYYRKAQQVRRLIAQDFASVFRDVDLLCAPTTPYTAFRLGERLDDPVQMYLADLCTSSVNLAGLPAISVPCGLGGEGLPIGLQIIGTHLGDATVFRAAHAYEQATEWHTRQPKGFE